ncbi:MAG: hypothetical protein ACP5QA_13805 [Phycisphaerae bacterium]
MSQLAQTPWPTAKVPHPDGTGTLIVHQNIGAWQHIVEKHVRNSEEPWEDVLSGELLQRLRMAQPGSWGAADLLGALQALWPLAERAAAAPLLLRQRLGGASHETIILLTPAGIVAILHMRGHSARLKTSYYPKVAQAEPNPQRRWRFVVHKYLRRYARWGPGPSITPPARGDVFRQSSHHTVSAVHFVSEENWGFRINNSGQAMWRPWWNLWGDATTPRAFKRRLLGRARHNRTMEDQ